MSRTEKDYRLGEAALRALELSESGYSNKQIARVLRAWWPHCTPVSGEQWCEDSVYLLVRCSSLFAYVYQGDLSTEKGTYALGLHARRYRKKFHEMHGSCLHDAVRDMQAVAV